MDTDVNALPRPQPARDDDQARWLAENKAAIAEYKAYVELHGLTLQDHRIV